MHNSFSIWSKIGLRFFLVWCALQVTRILFLIYNASFLNVAAADFIFTLPFDCCTIALYFLPYVFIYFFPVNSRYTPIKEQIGSSLFYLILVFLIIINMWDVAYFPFSQRRTTFDSFLFLIQSPDKGLIKFFILDFWWLSLYTLLLSISLIYVDYRWHKNKKNKDVSIKYQLLHFVLAALVFFTMGRWSFGLKPLGVLDANNYVVSENVPFILNTAFVTLKTIQVEKLPTTKLIDLETSKKYFNPIKKTVAKKTTHSTKNVVFIILESFGDKMLKQTVNGIKLTAFTDSLLNQSYYFENGIANGQQSIESLPAIFASLPNLMRTPYILSSFCNNKLNALPSILKTRGYSTAFFHGAKNGSMRFDSFSKILGFDNYYGLNEYPNKQHYDGIWGIPDGYFNKWAVDKISKMKQPFLVSIFTISSHHPYKIPIKYGKNISKKFTKEQLAFYYADKSLQLFFEKAASEKWYKNSLFVICADHIPQQLHSSPNSVFDKFHVPIAFFTPDKSLRAKKLTSYFQHLDIVPFILNYLGVESTYYAFGNLKSTCEGLVYLNGNYILINKDGEIHFNESKNSSTCNIKNSEKQDITKKNLLTLSRKHNLNRLKSMIARYRIDLQNNKTTNK